MPEITVRPVSVEGAAGLLTAGTQEVAVARETLASAGGAAEATGSATAAASYARMHATWADALGALGELLRAFGQATGDAAGAYETTDRSAIPQAPAPVPDERR